MTTTTAERTTAPKFTRAAVAVPSAGADPRIDGIARRFAKRFALISLALYHLPLFLNNYPSLGGGGFNETGLAPRWGHVFTVPGIWVARHLFHMTGDMRQARAGDNGDVGEEFARLLLAVAIGLVAAAVWAVRDRHDTGRRWIGETTRVLLRYAIALGLISYAWAKIVPMQFPPLSAFSLEQRFGDLRPMSVLWQFMEYSRPYAFFGGVMEAVVVVLLCVRRTATAGAIACLAVMSNVMLLNYAYDVPVKLYSTMIVVSAGVLLLYDLPRLTAVFFTNRPVEPAPESFIHQRVRPRVRWAIKAAAIGSVTLSTIVAMLPAMGLRPATQGIAGTWAVTSFARDGGPRDSSADAAPRWRRVIVDGRLVAIRLDPDSLLACGNNAAADGGPGAAAATGATTLALACGRERGGRLTAVVSNDTLRLTGTFDGGAVSVTARRLGRDAYPLFRRSFHLVSDR